MPDTVLDVENSSEQNKQILTSLEIQKLPQKFYSSKQ